MEATIPTIQPKQSWSRTTARSMYEASPAGARGFGTPAAGRVLFWVQGFSCKFKKNLAHD